MTKSFKDALSRQSGPIPGIKESRNVGGRSGLNGKSFSKSSTASTNPFNLKVNKPKFDVLNRADRGTRGNSTVSRTRAVAIRKATILPQLQGKTRAHASTFIDRRFGIREGSGVSSEEVMQERFAREQQRLARKQSRKSKFDLNSRDEDEDSGPSLTHGGRSIGQMNDEELETFDENLEDFDDEPAAYNDRFRSGQLDGEFVKAGHFGGGGSFASSKGSEERKSKQDVMKELIAKSKFYKHERQKVKEENELLVEDVNEAFASIRSALKPRDESDRMQQQSRIDEDEYEAVLKELAFDPRSKPSDRTFTPEEEEEHTKKRQEAQQKALQQRMNDNLSAVDLDDSNTTTTSSSLSMDPELKRISQRQFKLMREFCHSGSEEKYRGLIEYAVKQPRTMIQLGRSIRSDLGKLSISFTKRSNATGRGAVMPALGPIRLLLLVSRIFSCSDFHHVVASPAQLLLSYYLGVGRMTKLEHVQRALALVYCSLEFQRIGQRCVPEALQVLYTILRARSASDDIPLTKQHYFCRPMGRSVSESLRAAPKSSRVPSVSRLFGEDSKLTAGELLSFAEKFVQEWFEVLREGSYPALKEALNPFIPLLSGGEPLVVLKEIHAASSSASASLRLQAHKPLSLPLLNPDFAADYSLEHRKRNGGDSDEQSQSRMKRAHKREFKGAVRELKRDAAFLADHKIRETRRKDSEYKTKMNRIIGSIGNGN